MGLRKRKSLILPFIFGIIIGLLISYSIRSLHKSHSLLPICGNQQLSPIPFPEESTSHQVLTPDQVVNLASIGDGESKLAEKASYLRDKNVVKDVNKTRKLLFVGVMTARVFLDTRAKAVWETWAKEVEGKVVFFSGGNAYTTQEMRKSLNASSIPLVLLPGVDDSYPPQKKSFMMLKFMYENYGDDFEWFMRADDDVYVRGEKLADFLRQIDCRHLHFIGQAGRGNRMERGTLNLGRYENFCMGGPGIILSRPTLKKVAPNVQECLKDLYSTHEDVEVGRCVQRYAKVSCTWAYEMQTVFHHSFKGDAAFSGSLKRREIHKAITLHPVKDFKHIYRLHAYFQGLKIQDLLYEKIQIHRDILYLSQKTLPRNNSTLKYKTPTLKRFGPVVDHQNSHIIEDLTVTGLSPSLNKYSPKDLDDIIGWDFMSKGIFSEGTINPKLKLKSDGKEALEDVVREVMDSLNSHSRARGRIVDFKEILYGYRRVNPMHGADYILDLLMTYRKYRGKKITIPVRRHIYVQRPFGPLQMRLITSSTPISKSPTRIVMIVPLAGRYDTFKRFLNNFSSTCIDLFSVHESNPFELSLIIVLFGSNEEKDQFLLLVQRQRDLLSSFKNNDEPLCQIKMVQIDDHTEFSRGIGLETGISQCNDEDLLLLIDVDLIFTSNAIKRVYLNTGLGSQAYFPIVFSQYNPKFYSYPKTETKDCIGNLNLTLNCPLNSDVGYWREFGFGIGSFYKSDFRQAGGFDTSITGWGKEDVVLFDRFLLNTNLSIFRAPDPELIHVFHETECDSKLPKVQLDMCLGSKANTLGSETNLMKYILKQKSK